MRPFLDLGLPEALARGLAALGFEGPTAVQAAAIPALLEGRDLLMESETGTGKTFAYLGPALALAASRLEARREGPVALVAAPTQELAVQIGREAERLSAASGLGLPIAVLLGGTPIVKQEQKLKDKPILVVGTLGRLADLVALRKLRTQSLGLLVLDEADRILAPETEELGLALLKAPPRACARVLASATLPDRTRRIASPFLREPVFARVENRPVLAGDIEHWCFYCDSRKRVDFLRRFEAAVRPERCLVFLSNASRVESVVERLEARGLPIEGIHARLEKEARRHALERFAAGEIRYLVTSDLGARGLDIAGVSHVLSLDLPEEATVYVHRAGRTGRAGAKGVSVILADSVELQRASRIALRQGFSFRTKVLDSGQVLEPRTEEFFALVESAEAERHESYLKRVEAAKGRAGPRPSAPARPGPRAQRLRPEPAPFRPRSSSVPTAGAEGPATSSVPRPASEKPSRPARSSVPRTGSEGPATSSVPRPASEKPSRPARSSVPRAGAEGPAKSSVPRPASKKPSRLARGSVPKAGAEGPATSSVPRPASEKPSRPARSSVPKAGAEGPTLSGAKRRLAKKRLEEGRPERKLGKKEREAERMKDWPGHRKPKGGGGA